MKDLRRTVFGRQSGQETPTSSLCAEFSVRKCEPIVDKIDHVPAGHYGLNDEELDFIPSTMLRTDINDIKYRLGQDGAEEADE